jgi:uncharacterized protein (AIM24 family)
VKAGAGWTLAPGAYVAGSAGVKLEPRWAGTGALFSKDAAFWLGVAGEGSIWVCGSGAIEAIEIDGTHLVDAGHLVGFTGQLAARVRGARGKSAWLARGEGQVVELTGRGSALVQTRSTRALVGFLTPLLPE